MKFPQRTKFGEHTPPAIFPPIMGLFGLGLAWGHAERAFHLPAILSQMILGAVSVLFAFCVLAYVRKMVRRPGVLVEDLRVLPGRAGLTAMVLSIYLLAASLTALAPELARILLLCAAALHFGLVVLVVYLLATGPVEQRQITPVWHLMFVGIILAPLSAIPLGMVAQSQTILLIAGVTAVAIWAGSAWQLATHTPPAPLRPLLAIHLAPAAVLGTVAALLGQTLISYVLSALGFAIFAALLARARFITQSGFSPLWGAFTFPVAAFASFMLVMDRMGAGTAFALVGIVVLIAASALIPLIAAKVFQGWARGQLSVKTNAARA